MEEALLVHKTPQQLIWYNNLYSELETIFWLGYQKLYKFSQHMSYSQYSIILTAVFWE